MLLVSPAVRFQSQPFHKLRSQKELISVSSGSSQGASRLDETLSIRLPFESSSSASNVTEQSYGLTAK